MTEKQMNEFGVEDIPAIIKEIEKIENVLRIMSRKLQELENAVSNLSSEFNKQKVQDDLNFGKKSLNDMINNK